MGNQFHIDLEQFSLDKFKKSLKSREMIPSRVTLKDDLEGRFAILGKTGISNLKALTDRLKTKPKIEAFSTQTGLPVDYLTLLNREARSYLSKPVRIDKFEGLETQYVEGLEAAGIKNTRQLLNAAGAKTARGELSQKMGIPIDGLTEIVCLADLTRAYGVGPAYARMIYDMGIQTIQAFVGKTADDFVRIYEETTQKKADFGTNEIQFSLELAVELDILVTL